MSAPLSSLSVWLRRLESGHQGQVPGPGSSVQTRGGRGPPVVGTHQQMLSSNWRNQAKQSRRSKLIHRKTWILCLYQHIYTQALADMCLLSPHSQWPWVITLSSESLWCQLCTVVRLAHVTALCSAVLCNAHCGKFWTCADGKEYQKQLLNFLSDDDFRVNRPLSALSSL